MALRMPAEHAAPLAPPAVSSSSPAPPRPQGPPRPAVARAKLTREEIIRRDADRCLLERGDVKAAVRQL